MNSFNQYKSYSDRLTKTKAQAARKRNITLGYIRKILKNDLIFHNILDPRAIEEEETLLEPDGMLIVSNRMNGINGDQRHFNEKVKDDIALSTSHTTSGSITGNLQYQNTYNQTSHDLLCNQQNSYSRIAKSADTYFLSTNFLNLTHTRPKALLNPFAPATIRIPMVPGRRRWAHTFPIGNIDIHIFLEFVVEYCIDFDIKGPNNIPWHFHHLRYREGVIKSEMFIGISKAAHLIVPGTSKQILNDYASKQTHERSKTNSDSPSRSKR